MQTDLLLFHRKKVPDRNTSKKKRAALSEPIAPEEVEEMNVEVLIKENLDLADKKLEILSEQRLGVAVGEFVDKEQNKAFHDAMKETLTKQQKKLINRGEVSRGDKEDDDDDGKVTSAADVREIVASQSQAHREHRVNVEGSKTNDSRGSKRRSSTVGVDNDDDSLPAEKENEENDVAQSKKRKAASATKSRRGQRKTAPVEFGDFDSDDEEIVAQIPPPKPSRSTARLRRPTGRSKKVSYYEDESDNNDSDSDAVVEMDDDDDSDVVEVKPKKAPAASRRTTPKKAQPKTSSRSTARGGVSRTKRSNVSYEDDSSIEEVSGNAMGLEDNWGTANTNTER